MNEIELVFNKNGVTTNEKKKSLLSDEEKWIPTDQVSYDKLKSVGINIIVTSIIPNIKDGVLIDLKFKGNFSNIKYPEEKTTTPVVSEGPDKMPADMKKILDDGIASGIFRPHYVTFTRQLYQPGTEPFLIKKIIKDNGTISDNKLRDMLENEGYSRTAGGINATINVLVLVTKEIRVVGRGDNREYIWIEKKS